MRGGSSRREVRRSGRSMPQGRIGADRWRLPRRRWKRAPIWRRADRPVGCRGVAQDHRAQPDHGGALGGRDGEDHARPRPRRRLGGDGEQRHRPPPVSPALRDPCLRRGEGSAAGAGHGARRHLRPPFDQGQCHRSRAGRHSDGGEGSVGPARSSLMPEPNSRWQGACSTRRTWRRAAGFLLSDDARMVTGQVLAVDGGWGVTEAGG